MKKRLVSPKAFKHLVEGYVNGNFNATDTEMSWEARKFFKCRTDYGFLSDEDDRIADGYPEPGVFKPYVQKRYKESIIELEDCTVFTFEEIED